MPPTTVEKWHVHDFTLRCVEAHDNPCRVAATATLGHESGAEFRDIPAFHDGGDIWKVRFSPTIEGRWTGTVSSEQTALDGTELDPIDCVPNTNPNVRGRLQTDPSYPRRFAFENGDPFVPLGFECDWLFAIHQSRPEAFEELVDLIAARGFNYIVMNVYAHAGFSDPSHEWVFSPPDLYPFGGSNDDPDHSTINVDFFRKFDEVMAALHARGIVSHLMISVQNKRVNWPEHYTADDDQYWRYVVARYQAYGNLVWDVGKESYNFKRRWDDAGYALNRVGLIRDVDAYGHLVTVHDAVGGSAAYSSPIDDATDFVSDQIHLSDSHRYYREAARRFRTMDKPYMNIEYGYELGAEDIKTYSSRTTRPWQDVLRWTYAIYAGGGYPGYYYNNTSWDLVKYDPEPEGWRRYQYLADFMRDVNLNRMAPDNEYVDRGLCSAEHGRQYFVFLPEGGDVSMDLTGVARSAPLTARWMDVYTGETKEAPVGGRGFTTHLDNPFDDAPTVLLVAAS